MLTGECPTYWINFKSITGINDLFSEALQQVAEIQNFNDRTVLIIHKGAHKKLFSAILHFKYKLASKTAATVRCYAALDLVIKENEDLTSWIEFSAEAVGLTLERVLSRIEAVRI